MGFGVFVLLIAVATAQELLSFTFNETFAQYGQGTFWDGSWSRLALLGTSHMPETSDPLFFNDGRGLVFSGNQVVRLPPHPLDPRPVELGKLFAFEFWFRTDISWPAANADRYLLTKVKSTLDTSSTILAVMFRRTGTLSSDMTVKVMDLWIDGTAYKLDFTIPRLAGFSEVWDRWFHLVINVDASGTTTTGNVYLDGVLMTAIDQQISSSVFSDTSDGALLLGGRVISNTINGTPYSNFNNVNAGDSAQKLIIYVAKIYTKQNRDEAGVKALISNTCLGRFDRGDLKYLCDACPVNLGRCLYSGCAYNGYQRASAECVDDPAICDASCNAGTASGYCTSDSQCSSCTHGSSNYYISSNGACKTCSIGCQACTNSVSCYECKHPSASPWTGGISLQKGKCSGVFALQMDATCFVEGLQLPMPPKTTYTAWTITLWVYIQSAVPTTALDTDYEILNLGDYQLTYTSANRFRMRTRGGEMYEDTAAGAIFTVGKWTRVAFVTDGTTGTLMVWNNFAVTDRLTSLGVSKFSLASKTQSVFPQPKQLLFCSKKCNVLLKDFRLWSEARTEAQIFDTMFQVITRPPATLAAYWRLDEGMPMIFDYSINALNRTLPQTRGDCWWKEQEVQYLRHTDSSLADNAQISTAGTAGFLQCAEKRLTNNILFLCNEEIRFIFSQKCMPQDILDVNRTVVARRGNTELADVDTDPVYNGKEAGLYFSGKSYLEIDPKRQAFQPVSETRWSTRQSESRGVRMPLTLIDFTVQVWVKPESLPTTAFAEDNGYVTNVYTLFSIMHTNGHHQFLWYIHKDGVGVSMRSATTGFRWGERYSSTTDHPTPTSRWTFLQFAFALSNTNDMKGSMTMIANGASLTLSNSGILTFGNSLQDFVVREQAPMYLGAVVKGTVLSNFYQGYMFEFALSNFAKPNVYATTYDYFGTVTQPYSPWFGSSIGTDQMTGNECACHFSCLTCKSPRTGLPTDCLSCSAPLVLTSSNKCELSCPANTVMDSESSRVCVAVTAPTVTEAKFRSDFLGIDVTFDVEVAPSTRRNDCARMFAAETSVQFGFNSYCSQSTPKTISVYFGQSPSLPLAGQITLHPIGILKAGSSLLIYAAVGPYTLKDATGLISPTAIIAGADLSPVNGTDVTIDASFSRGGLGRMMTFKWSVTADGVTLSPDLTAYLAKYSDFTSTSRLTIPANLAPTSVRVTYTVTVSNWLQKTSTASIDSFHTLRPAPIVYFTQGRVWTVNRWEDNVFQLKIVKSALVNIPTDKVLTARIVDTNADSPTVPLLTSQFLQLNQTLSIPAFTLQVSKYYKIVIELTSKSHPECNTFASLLLNVRQSGFIAQIVGGDRTIGVLDKVNVTSIGSVELDTKSNATLVYAWKCGDCTPSTSTGFNYTADLAATSVGKTVRVDLTITSSVKDDVRTATEYAEFLVVDGRRPYTFVHRLTNSTAYQLLPETASFLHAETYPSNITTRIEPHVSWSASPAPMDYSPSFAPRKHFLNTAVLAAGLYLPSRQYQVSMTLDENGLYTTAWIRAQVNARPIGCCFTATLVAGSRNLYLFDAGQHEDPDLNYPLSYVFGLEKYNAHLNFGRQTQQGKYILPSRDNSEENYQQTVYVIVYDSLGAMVKETYEVAVFPETPKYTLSDFQAEAAKTYATTYNQTVLDQYVLASYASFLADQFARNSRTLNRSQLSSEVESLVSLLTSIVSAGDQDCFDLKVYLRDLALLSRYSSLLSSPAKDSLFSTASLVLGKVSQNPNKNCWSAADKARFMTVYNDFVSAFPEHTDKQAQLVPLLETFGFVALRNVYPGDSVAYVQERLAAKFWRLPAENADLAYEFFPDEFNGTVWSKAGVTFANTALTAQQQKYGTVLDAHLIVYRFNSYSPLRIDKYPNLLAAKQLDRFEIIENTNLSAALLQVRIYESGSAVESDVTLLDTPTLIDFKTTPVTLQLPLFSLDPSSLFYTTCETWLPATNSTSGSWTIDNCSQNATISTENVTACKCKGLATVSSNKVAQGNVGHLRVAIVQATLDPEYDLKKEINDNRGFMFYMNAIYLLFILWSLHGGAIILAYIADRDGKPEFDKDEYHLVAGTERRLDVPRLPPIPSCLTYWLNEWWLTGLIRSTKPHYTRCARVHILFSKMYVLLLVPGFFYTYYWTGHQAFDIQGYDWGVTMISLICSAAAQGLLSVLSNTRNVPVAIKRSLYISYFGLWTTAWLAIGFWTAKGTTQTASIWCVIWLLCAFIDVLVVDHIYVMVKWGFDSATDYWRIVSAARNSEAE